MTAAGAHQGMATRVAAMSAAPSAAARPRTVKDILAPLAPPTCT